jgi:hypothetical protein
MCLPLGIACGVGENDMIADCALGVCIRATYALPGCTRRTDSGSNISGEQMINAVRISANLISL